MGLQLSTKRPTSAHAHAYENYQGQGGLGVELSHVDDNTYDSLDDHIYEDAGMTATPNAGVTATPNTGVTATPNGGVANIPNAGPRKKAPTSSEVTLSRRYVIILVMSGVILSTMISIITGVVVYHVTDGKAMQTDPGVHYTSQKLDALVQLQSSVIRLQEVFEQSQTTTKREFDTLKQTQVNATRELSNTLERKLANTTRELGSTLERKLANATRELTNTLERKLASATRELSSTLERKLANATRELNNTLERKQAITRGELDDLEQMQTRVNQHLDTLEQAHNETSSYVETLTGGQSTTNRQLQLLQEKLINYGQQVAFSVYRFNWNISVPDGTPTFTDTATNTGHYNMTSGRFTCPVAGLYQFSLSLEHDRRSSGEAECYFRGNGFGTGVYVAVRQDSHEMAYGSVIQHLSVNDTVGL